MAQNKSKNEETIQKIHLYDGYGGEPIFKGFGNYSTYYHQQTDEQCTVPVRSIAEIQKELGL